MDILKAISPLVFVAFVSGVSNPAQAGFPAPQTLTSGAAISYDGLTFTVSSCSFTLNGVSTSSCASADDSLAISASNRGAPTLEILGDSSGINGTNALVCSDCGSATSLLIGLTVTATGGSSPQVTTISNTITGSPSESANVTSLLTYSSSQADVSLANPNASTGTFTNILPSSMAVSLTLGLASNPSSTLTLANDELFFSPAPEPETFVLLATGLLGLGVARPRLFPRSRHNRPARQTGAER